MLHFNDKKFINLPNAISFLALFLSWIGIIFLLNDKFYVSFFFALLAFITDFLDGFLARRLHLESDVGKQLDSLIDLCTYLIYPALAFYLYFYLKDPISLLIIFLFLTAGIIRLVRFNIMGFVALPDVSNKAYVGLPVVFSHVLLLVLLALKRVSVPYFAAVADVLILSEAFLMVQTFRYPKPRKIVPLMLLILLIALLMLYLGTYGTN